MGSASGPIEAPKPDIMRFDVEALAAQQKAQVAYMTQLTSGSYDKATAYTNVIVLAGYAGIFAIWSFIRDQLNDTLEVWIALLTGVSLFTFVLFEIVKMVITSITVRRTAILLQKEIAAGHWQTALAKHEAVQQRTLLRFGRFWVFTLVATIVPAISAAGLLFYGLAIKLPIKALKFW